MQLQLGVLEDQPKTEDREEAQLQPVSGDEEELPPVLYPKARRAERTGTMEVGEATHEEATHSS